MKSQINYFNINKFYLGRLFLALSLLTLFILDFENSVFNKLTFYLPNATKNFNLFLLLGYENLFYSKLFSIIILTMVVLNILPKIISIFHWWVSFSFFHSAYLVEGGDQISMIITFLLIPICFYNIQYNKSLSFSSNFPYIVNIIELLIIFQISSLYFHAFIGKLAVKEWTDGTACFYWLTNETFGLPNSIISFIKPVLHNRFIILILTWGTLLIELVLALGFLFKQEIKNYIFVIGVVFHFLIWIFHGLGNFMLAMDAALILYLLPKNIKIPIYVYR